MAQDMWSDKLESMQLERQLREGRRQRQQAENEQRLGRLRLGSRRQITIRQRSRAAGPEE